MDLEQKTLVGERQKLAALRARLEADDPLSSHELHAVWDERARPFWRIQPEIYRALAEQCRRAGENFLAIEAAEEGLAWFSEDLHPAEYLKLVHVRAQSYANVGARDRARELVESIRHRQGDSFTALHLLARTHKDWFEMSEEDDTRREHLTQARDACLAALAREPSAALAINAAAASLLLDRDDPATGPLAQRARQLCLREHASTHFEDEGRATFERVSLLAECSLILGNVEEARRLYAQAGELGHFRRSDLLSTRKQVRLLLAAMGRDAQEFDPCFPLPNVALYTGHLFDLPARSGPPRFPTSNASLVQARIRETLAAHNVLIAYGSASGGADLLFLREVLARPGGEVHVVLPFARERFRREGVVRHPSLAAWGEEFDRILDAAASVTELTDSPCWFDDNAFAFGNRVLHGMAERRAREFGEALRTFAVWDGRGQAERKGGTADCVRHWAARGCARTFLPPDGGLPREETGRTHDASLANLPVNVNTAGAPQEGAAVHVIEDICAVLSGEWESTDATLHEGERSWLVGAGTFFWQAAQSLEAFGAGVLHRWVDGPRFRLVFDDLDQAGRAACALRDRAAEGSGRLRLGLHAGPVIRWRHPLLQEREEPEGIHLGKADRLAAIPWCGRIRASREFVALVEAAPLRPGQRRLRCVYQGAVPLGVPFGRQALFVVTA